MEEDEDELDDVVEDGESIGELKLTCISVTALLKSLHNSTFICYWGNVRKFLPLWFVGLVLRF